MALGARDVLRALFLISRQITTAALDFGLA